MRRVLNVLYRASGGAAALFLVAIAVVVLLQVGANVVDFAVRAAGGEPPSLLVPSYADFTGYFLAASSFLALAPTFRAGEHIRVELLIGELGPARRQVAELWCLFVAFCLCAYITYYVSRLAYEAWRFGDKSEGIVPVPLWIPQSGLLLGLAVLAIALLDAYVGVLRRSTGKAPAAAGDPATDRETQVDG